MVVPFTSLAHIAPYTFTGSFIAACTRNYPLNPTWKCAKGIGQSTLSYTVMSFVNLQLAVILTIFLKTKEDQDKLSIIGFLAVPVIPIYFAAKAFPNTFGTPAQALLSFAIFTAFTALGLLSKHE